jgi:hypothetical protein
MYLGRVFQARILRILSRPTSLRDTSSYLIGRRSHQRWATSHDLFCQGGRMRSHAATRTPAFAAGQALSPRGRAFPNGCASLEQIYSRISRIRTPFLERQTNLGAGIGLEAIWCCVRPSGAQRFAPLTLAYALDPCSSLSISLSI